MADEKTNAYLIDPEEGRCFDCLLKVHYPPALGESLDDVNLNNLTALDAAMKAFYGEVFGWASNLCKQHPVSLSILDIEIGNDDNGDFLLVGIDRKEGATWQDITYAILSLKHGETVFRQSQH